MTAIVAMTPSRIIGFQGKLPWHLPEDLRFFKQTTLGHVVLMGRRTFDSIGKPLPGRDNWVVTSGPPIPGTQTICDPNHVPPPPEGKHLYLIGGAKLYAALLPQCTDLLITHVNKEYEGDTRFPEFRDNFEPAEILTQTPDFTIRRHTRKPSLLGTE